MLPLKLLITLQSLTILISSVSTTEFVYNTNFNSTNINLYGNATIQNSILTLTNGSFFSIGRAFYPQKISTKITSSSPLLPFATSFIYSVAPLKNLVPGHGFVFIFAPSRGINGTAAAEYNGLFNFTNKDDPKNHVLGVEFDPIKNEEFQDINDNHIGVDINSLKSKYAHKAGYWEGENPRKLQVLKITSGENYQVWIEFMFSQLNITMARAGQKRPRVPLISKNVNLSGVLMDETYVGFCAATGLIVDSTKILAWSFSNSNFSIGDALVTHNLPSFVHHKARLSKRRVVAISVVLVLIVGCVCVVFFIFFRGKKVKEEIEDWELE